MGWRVTLPIVALTFVLAGCSGSPAPATEDARPSSGPGAGAGAVDTVGPAPDGESLVDLVVAPADAHRLVGQTARFSALGLYTDGLWRTESNVEWVTTSETVATVSQDGVADATAIGTTKIAARVGGIEGTSQLNVLPNGIRPLRHVGVTGQFERRGETGGYYSGDLIQRLHEVDASPHIGTEIADEVALQMERMRSLGVDTIWFELRTADPYATYTFEPPLCNEPPVLGLRWPVPTETEVANLRDFFDLAHQHGIRVWLFLVNVHFEESSYATSEQWLAPIVDAVGGHPALDLVLLGGNSNMVDTNGDGVADACGIPAEAPLWEGRDSPAGHYVAWAIDFLRGRGVPFSRISAEAIVGSYVTDAEQYGLSHPVRVLRTIFDDLGVPLADRVYALSWYQHVKCSDATLSGCEAEDTGPWGETTIRTVRDIVGDDGGRIIAAEMGWDRAHAPGWSEEKAVENLGALMQQYGVEGGAYYPWAVVSGESPDQWTNGDPVKRPGVEFSFTPVHKELLDLSGFHLPMIRNPSFESGSVGDPPTSWTSANGPASQVLGITEDVGAHVPTRGRYVAMLEGAEPVCLTSSPSPAAGNTEYTIAANIRLEGDASGGFDPRASFEIQFFGSDGVATSQPSQTWEIVSETNGFDTFVYTFTTPGDATEVRLEFCSLGEPGRSVDMLVDNVR